MCLDLSHPRSIGLIVALSSRTLALTSLSFCCSSLFTSRRFNRQGLYSRKDDFKRGQQQQKKKAIAQDNLHL